MTTGPKYRIDVDSKAGTKLVTVSGEIDMASAPELEGALASEPAATVIADLADVGFIDSSGLRSLLSACEGLDEAGGRLLLVFGEGPVSRIIDLTGLADRFEIFETVEAAAGAAG